MIAKHPPIDNIWKAVSIAWGLSFGMVIVYCVPLFDLLGYDLSFFIYLSWANAAVTVLLWGIGNFYKKSIQRVLFVFLIFFVFGGIPLLFLLLISGFGYFLFYPDNRVTMTVFLVFLAVVFALRVCFSLKSFIKRIVGRRFIERELHEDENRVIFSRPSKTNLAPSPIGDYTPISKIFYVIFPKMILLVPMAYPLQKLIVGYGPNMAIYLVLSCLCGPLAIIFSEKLACYAYLYVFKVIQLERQTGKPVVFEEAEGE